MSDRKKNVTAFDILNQELRNGDSDPEYHAGDGHAGDGYTREDSGFAEQGGGEAEGRGCVGNVLRVLLILFIAAALSWIVFMPEGSLGELWDRITSDIGSADSWAADFVSGLVDGGRQGESDPVESDDASSVADVSSDDRQVSSDDRQVSSEPVSSDGDDGDGDDGGAVSSSETGDNENVSYSITVFRLSQIVIVYDAAGNPAKVFSCSSGKESTPTQLGDYNIRAKYRWRYMVGDCYTQYATSFSSGYLFHSIPYNRKNPASMSDSSYDKLGSPASSGCVRLCFRDTKWIYDNCPIGTDVHVIDEEAPSGAVPEIIPERIKDAAHDGWDPTDDSTDSPYNQ